MLALRRFRRTSSGILSPPSSGGPSVVTPIMPNGRLAWKQALNALSSRLITVFRYSLVVRGMVLTLMLAHYRLGAASLGQPCN